MGQRWQAVSVRGRNSLTKTDCAVMTFLCVMTITAVGDAKTGFTAVIVQLTFQNSCAGGAG